MASAKQFLVAVGSIKKHVKYAPRPSRPMSEEHAARERALFQEINALVEKYSKDQFTIVCYDRANQIAHVSGNGGTHTY